MCEYGSEELFIEAISKATLKELQEWREAVKIDIDYNNNLHKQSDKMNKIREKVHGMSIKEIQEHNAKQYSHMLELIDEREKIL